MSTTRTRGTRGVTLSPMIEGAFAVGCGWNSFTKGEIEELRRIWAEHGDAWLTKRRAKFGDSMAESAWALMEFGTPAEAAAQLNPDG